MAGLIARLFGGKPSPAVDMEPAPGIGGYHLGTGPAGQTGFPGSTAQTRTFPSNGRSPYSPRAAKINADYDSDANNRSGTTADVRQASYRGDVGGARTASPRSTPRVATPQSVIRQTMQNNSAAEFYGGPALKTGPGNLTAGGQPLSAAAQAGGHSAIQTTTPYSDAQPEIGGAPGSENVRNSIALRYKAAPGEMHTYKSHPRPDQAQVNPGGQATDGNVNGIGITQDVTVPSRAVFEQITWAVLREMPYGGRGDGARGADLNGQRYYAAGQAGEFLNAGQGDFGIARQNGSGNKRPVSFTQPAPWTANYYDTTNSVGTADNPNQQPEQQPQAVYYSPGGLRASNSTGRTS
jgi:hypothetical protein